MRWMAGMRGSRRVLRRAPAPAGWAERRGPQGGNGRGIRGIPGAALPPEPGAGAGWRPVCDAGGRLLRVSAPGRSARLAPTNNRSGWPRRSNWTTVASWFSNPPDPARRKKTVAKTALTRRLGFIQSQGVKVHMMHPAPAASRWKTMLSTFLGVIFEHPRFTPPPLFPRNPLFPASSLRQGYGRQAGTATGSCNGLYAKSKFLAASLLPCCAL
jgi:hypothetical protein